MKLVTSLIASCVVLTIYSIGFSDDRADLDARVQAAIKHYEGCFVGCRYTLVRGQDTQRIELNAARPLIARSMQEYSLPGGRRARFGHYFSEPLLQYFYVKEQADPQRPVTDSIERGVVFLEKNTQTKILEGMVPYFYFSPAKSLTEIYNESLRSGMPNGSEMRFEHSSGTIILCEINSRDLFTRITQKIGPGVTLADGSKAPKGVSTETTLKFQWNDESSPVITEILTEVKVNGSVKGKGRILVKDLAPLESPLGSLISLDGFGLESGEEVSCEALPGRFFQFMDGRVVAVADSQALSAARKSRWRKNFVGSAFYYGLFTFLLLGIGGFVLWKRR